MKRKTFILLGGILVAADENKITYCEHGKIHLFKDAQVTDSLGVITVYNNVRFHNDKIICRCD